MLYAASLYWLTPRCIIVAAGSALGEVIVWSLSLQKDDKSDWAPRHRIKTHYWFPGHDGSIFGTALTEIKVASEDHYPQLLLATCSDDRTIRIWNVSKVLLLAQKVDELPPEQLNEAGEVTNPADLSDLDTELSAPCITRAWGHLSRIWQVAFVESDESSEERFASVGLISVGEDATLQLWNLVVSKDELKGYSSGELRHVSTHRHHSGKNIWSFTYSRQMRQISSARSESTKWIDCATGGADGSVSMFTIDETLSGCETASPSGEGWEIEDVFSQLFIGTDIGGMSTEHIKATKRDFFRDSDFVSDHNILITTNSGHIILGTFGLLSNPGEEIGADQHPQLRDQEWRLLAHISALSSYSIVVGVPAARTGFIAGANGSVYTYNEGSVHEDTILMLEVKISSLFAQVVQAAVKVGTPTSPMKCQQLVLLVIPMKSALASLVFFEYAPGAEHSLRKQSTNVIQLEIPHGFVTSAMLCLQIGGEDNVIFLGSRSGHVIKYLIGSDRTYPIIIHPEHSQLPEIEPFQFHQDAITSFTWNRAFSATGDYLDDGYVLSTGRDSSYAVHKISLQTITRSPLPVHRVNLPFGPNIEGLYITNSHHLVFYGFKSKDFIVFDETSQTELMRIECGGAHRVWTFQPQLNTGNGNIGRFVWTKGSKINTWSGAPDSYRAIKSGGHGREIKACAVCPVALKLGIHSGSIIATGAEDTNIRLFQYRSKTGDIDQSQLNSIAIVRKHDTGIQQLQWSSDGRYLFSSGGCEEFCVWRIRSVPFTEIGVVCESTLPPVSPLLDLRIMGFEALCASVSHSETASSEEESSKFIICMVLSDSSIRVRIYSQLYEWARKLIQPYRDIFTPLPLTNRLGLCYT